MFILKDFGLWITPAWWYLSGVISDIWWLGLLSPGRWNHSS